LRAIPGAIDEDLALADDRVIELADLVALRKVGVEVILAVEARIEIDLRLQSEPGAHRLLDTVSVDHGKHSRHRGIDEADVRVGRSAKSGRSTREQFGVRLHLRVNFHSDDYFPIALRPRDDLGFGFGIGEFGHSVHLSRVCT
jgi:hypothetical protein